MNKIKDSYNNIKLSKNAEENILNKTIYKKTTKIFKLSYIATAFVLLLVSLSIVYAKDISEFIKKWGGIDRIFKNGEIINEPVKESVNTKIDNLELNQNIKYDEWMTLSEAEEYLGINILTINKDRTEKDTELMLGNYISNYKDNKVQVITVRQVDFIPKSISLYAEFITKNFPNEFVESFNNDTGWAYESLEYIDTIKLDKLNVEATIYSNPSWDFEKDKKDKDLYNIKFIYKNIEYNLAGFDDTTLEELIEIANQLN